MKTKIFLIIILLFLTNILQSQVLDNNVPMSKDKIYLYLLKKHVNFLEKTKQFSTYKDDTTLFVMVDIPITSELPQYLKGRKIVIIDNNQIDSLLDLRALNVIRIFPIYFKGYNIHLECEDYIVNKKSGSLLFLGGDDGTSLTIKFNCSTGKYELLEIRH